MISAAVVLAVAIEWYSRQVYIRGRVIDAETGKPVAGARVVVLGFE